jgi:hypothetical protein
VDHRQEPHDRLGVGVGSESREAPQITEHDHHLGLLGREDRLVARPLDVLDHLRCQEPAQARDASPALLREGDLGRHAVEAFGQRLELVAGGDPDPMLELPGAEPLGPLLQSRIGPTRLCASQ